MGRGGQIARLGSNGPHLPLETFRGQRRGLIRARLIRDEHSSLPCHLVAMFVHRSPMPARLRDWEMGCAASPRLLATLACDTPVCLIPPGPAFLPLLRFVLPGTLITRAEVRSLTSDLPPVADMRKGGLYQPRSGVRHGTGPCPSASSIVGYGDKKPYIPIPPFSSHCFLLECQPVSHSLLFALLQGLLPTCRRKSPR